MLSSSGFAWFIKMTKSSKSINVLATIMSLRSLAKTLLLYSWQQANKKSPWKGLENFMNAVVTRCVFCTWPFIAFYSSEGRVLVMVRTFFGNSCVSFKNIPSKTVEEFQHNLSTSVKKRVNFPCPYYGCRSLVLTSFPKKIYFESSLSLLCHLRASKCGNT